MHVLHSDLKTLEGDTSRPHQPHILLICAETYTIKKLHSSAFTVSLVQVRLKRVVLDAFKFLTLLEKEGVCDGVLLLSGVLVIL